ncbi:MAG: hypothetical protein AB1782_14150 [Cyanobacteriota bacterium]
MTKGYWTYKLKPAKLTKNEKEIIKAQVLKFIDSSEKLKEKVSRIDLKAGRVYLYHLVEQFHAEGAILIKPLIDGKYCEFHFGRITLYDSKGYNCTADWQRYNDQWFNLHEGTLENCLIFMESDAYFS